MVRSLPIKKSPQRKHRPVHAEQHRYTGLVRLLQMIELLRREPYDVEALAAELAVTRRTAYRYLHVIDRAGALNLRYLGHLRRTPGESCRVYYRIEPEPGVTS